MKAIGAGRVKRGSAMLLRRFCFEFVGVAVAVLAAVMSFWISRPRTVEVCFEVIGVEDDGPSVPAPFPRFDPALGTLRAVRFEADWRVSARFAFTAGRAGTASASEVVGLLLAMGGSLHDVDASRTVSHRFGYRGETWVDQAEFRGKDAWETEEPLKDHVGTGMTSMVLTPITMSSLRPIGSGTTRAVEATARVKVTYVYTPYPDEDSADLRGYRSGLGER